ncbi:mads-box protein jointless, partial [Quercus suber]
GSGERIGKNPKDILRNEPITKLEQQQELVIERRNLHPENLGKMDQLSLELQTTCCTPRMMTLTFTAALKISYLRQNGTSYAMLNKETEEKTHELRNIRGEELPGMDIEELQKLKKELVVGLSRQ